MVTPENIQTAAQIAQDNPNLVNQIVNILTKFGFPFNFGKSTTSPFAAILNIFLTQLKQSDAMVQSPAASSLIDVISNVVTEMDQSKDPFSALAQQAEKMAGAVMESTFDSIPHLVGAVSTILFPVQSRSIESILGDVTGQLGAFIKPFEALLGTAQKDIEEAIRNITNIRSDKDGINFITDLSKQTIIVAQNIVKKIDDGVRSASKTTTNQIAGVFQEAINNVNTVVYQTVYNMLQQMSQGSMMNCAAPINNSMSILGHGLTDGVESCVNTEVDMVLDVLTKTSTALGKTTDMVNMADGLVNSLMVFNMFDVGMRIWPLTQLGFETVALYTELPIYATAVVPTMQTRLTTCVAAASLNTMKDAAIAATPLASCVFT